MTVNTREDNKREEGTQQWQSSVGLGGTQWRKHNHAVWQHQEHTQQSFWGHKLCHNNGEKPQQWGKATTMGRHNRLFVAACFCFCYFYFYNCPNQVISVQHTTSQQKSTNEEQMTAGERYKSQTTARHQNRFMQTTTAQHQMIIDFGPLYLFSTAATTVVSYGYWLAVRTPRCQCGHHLIVIL